MMNGTLPSQPSSLLFLLLEWKKEFQAPILFSAWDNCGEGFISSTHLYPIIRSLFPPPLSPEEACRRGVYQRFAGDEPFEEKLRLLVLQHYSRIISSSSICKAFRNISSFHQLSSFSKGSWSRTQKPRKSLEFFSFDDLINAIDHLCRCDCLSSKEEAASQSGPSLSSSFHILRSSEFSSTDNEMLIHDENEKQRPSLSCQEEENILGSNENILTLIQRNVLCLLFGELERVYMELTAAEGPSTYQKSKEKKWKSVVQLFSPSLVSSSRPSQLLLAPSQLGNASLNCLGKQFSRHEATCTVSYLSSTLEDNFDTSNGSDQTMDFVSFLSSAAEANVAELIYDLQKGG